MKIAGRKIEGVNTETVIIPRGDGPDIVFICQAVLDDEPFVKLCPPPMPPKYTKPGNIVIENVKDPTYIAQTEEYARKKLAWTIIESLKATPDLEWEVVKPENSETWLKVWDELTESGFSAVEKTQILNGVLSANCLNEAKLEKAREAFFRTRAAELERLASLSSGRGNTPSGEPAKESA